MDALLTVSVKELRKLEVMQRSKNKRLKQREAAELLGISVRQVKRLNKAYRENGAKGLASKRCGRESNHRLKKEIVAKVLNLVHGKYKGFGPTLAHEKIVELEKVQISDESVRKIMILGGAWKPRKARKWLPIRCVNADPVPVSWCRLMAPRSTLRRQ